MARQKHRGNGRDGNQFVALPYVVLDSPSYLGLSFSARALLVDVARQYGGGNNGKLVICDRVLKTRGWKSTTTIHKAKAELVDGGFLCQTRQGYKPNKSSWFAVTWQCFDWTSEMDIERKGFRRGAYLEKKIDPQKME